MAYDGWLDMDYILLSRISVASGAYTTALLFLELATEYRDCQDPAAVIEESVLFQIYSHIDEPDGFYGIQSTDLRGTLLKRFHHENRWEQAFRFHGAALEAASTDHQHLAGTLRSLCAFGFDRLAMTSYREVSAEDASSTEHTSMGYRLGWRTETWDLPDIGGVDETGRSLYLAMRAICRERDPHAVDVVLEDALRNEIDTLRRLGEENIAGIRNVVQDLLCIQQVAYWRDHLIEGGEDTSSLIESFCHIQDDFE
jgi:ataxia telangiectasia mutated family protein